MNTTFKLTLSSIKMYLRNRQALFFGLFTPLIIMVIFGFIGFDKIQKINIGLVANSPSQHTQVFIDQLKKIPVFAITSGSEADERKALENGDRTLVLLVPGDFLPDGANLHPPRTLTALTNAGDQQVPTALSIINQTLGSLNLAILGAPNLFNLQTQTINVHNLKYIDFLLPGVVALAIMQMAVFSVAFVFADYREKGVLKRLLATPMRPYQFLTANVITRLLIALLQATILIAVGVLAFHVHVVGSYALVGLVSILGGIMFLGLGFTISGFAKTVESVPAIANLVVFPMLFLGGSFFPITSMPTWLQHIAKYLPLTYFSDSLRQVMTKGATINGIHSDLLWMLAWSIVLVVAATITFRFGEKNN